MTNELTEIQLALVKGSRVAFEYETMPIEDVAACFQTLENPDSYLTDDHQVKTLRRLRAAGFRWVRTDDGWAIFERAYLEPVTSTDPE